MFCLENSRTEKKDFVTTCASFGLPLCALLIGYPQGIVSAGNTIGMLILCFGLIKRKNIGCNKVFMYFIVFYIFRLFINFFTPQVMDNTGAYTKELVRILCSIFVTIGLSYYAEEEQTFTAWRIIAIIPILALLYQCIQIYILHNNVSPILLLPFGEINDLNLLGMDTWHVMSSRPMSTFQEPGGYATFMLPLLYMMLKHKKTVQALMITLSIMLCTSTLGLICVTIIWLVFTFSTRASALRAITFIGIMLVLGICFFSLPIFEPARNKMIDPDFAAKETIAYRIVNGFRIYAALPWHEQLCGIFYLNLASYMADGKIVISGFSPRLFGYINNIGKVLTEAGIIGAILYINFFIQLIAKAKWNERAYILVVFAIAFAQKSFMTPSMCATYAPLLLFTYTTNKHVKLKLC